MQNTKTFSFTTDEKNVDGYIILAYTLSKLSAQIDHVFKFTNADDDDVISFELCVEHTHTSAKKITDTYKEYTLDKYVDKEEFFGAYGYDFKQTDKGYWVMNPNDVKDVIYQEYEH